MIVSLPIYVESTREAQSHATVFHCRPLLFQGPSATDLRLGRALSKLTQKTKRQLDEYGRFSRHEDLARLIHCPELETQTLKISIDLRNRVAKCPFLFVVQKAFDRQVAFTPSIPELWFELTTGETLEQKATEVLTKHFRDVLRTDAASSNFPETVEVKGKAWVTTIDIDIRTQQETRIETERKLRSLWDDEYVDGATELQRVGRCLDWLYPDDLERVIFRDDELDRLTRLLDGGERRPVLLVGPRLAGKTAIVHDFVHQRVSGRRRPYATKRNTWLLSPQRLISGMMYVGQWENRLLAILKHAARRDHVLYFDDLLGMFEAGKSRDSNLCVADVLKTHIAQRRVRVLGEMTPEMLHVFQERDRGLADQFQIIPVQPTDEDTTLSILLAVARQLESQYRARLDLDVIPAVLNIQRRYVRDAEFPGKAAQFLRQAVSKHENSQVTRKAVIDEFSAKTGLRLSLLDQRRKLSRESVIEDLHRRMIGQDEALNAAADVIGAAKARLNPVDRPLATFLYLGPTGVGKTQCAKTLAGYLFGDPDKLIRFDMNEFSSPAQAARLVGSFDDPEGLLTSAVRRQPFSVILLDEIEKAHPDVFDMLLQVTGEGRLTDARGRTADFAQAIVIMTSNLGTREAGRNIGFAADKQSRTRTFVKAAQDFFRPEFFNRIDRIIPFSELSRDEIKRIAQLIIEEVLRRDGFVRRRSILHVDARAMERVIDEGYHPQLGARALKRAIERNLTRPVAARLSEIHVELPTVVSLYRQADELTVQVQSLEDAAPLQQALHPDPRPEQTIPAATTLLARVDESIQNSRPSLSLEAAHVGTQHLKYFAIQEQVLRVRELSEQLDDWLAAVRDPTDTLHFAPKVRSHAKRLSAMSFAHGSERRIYKEICSAEDIHAYLREVAQRQTDVDGQSGAPVTDLLHESALLEAMFNAQDAPERVAMYFRSLVELPVNFHKSLCSGYRRLFQTDMSFDCEDSQDASELAVLTVAGPFIWPMAKNEEGIHLFLQADEGLVPVQVVVEAIDAEVDAAHARQSFAERRDLWLARLERREATIEDDPYSLGCVLRLYDEASVTLDLRTGLTSSTWKDALRTFLMAGLELPPEFREETSTSGFLA